MSTSRPPLRRGTRFALVAFALATALACGDGTSPSSNKGFAGTMSAAFAPDTVSPGEPADITIHLPTRADNAPFKVVTTFGGAARGVDTLTVGGQAGLLHGTLAVPAGVADGDVSYAVAIPGTTFRDTAWLYVRDRKPPLVSGSIAQLGPVLPMASLLPPDYQLVAGGRLTLRVEATDNVAMGWIGYEFGPPFGQRDSMAVIAGGAGTDQGFTVQIPESLAGAATTYTVFARDAKGNRATKLLGTTRFYRYLDRVVRTAALDAAVRGVAYDAARDRLYLSQPSSNRIAVLALATMTWLPPIAAPLPPGGLDLSLSGDSLLVALERSVYLGIVDLRVATPTLDTLRLHFNANPFVPTSPTDMRPWPSDVRIAADGRVLVSFATPGAEDSDKLLALDLATGTQSLLASGYAGTLALTRPGDRRSVLVTGGAFGGVRYRAATHDIAFVNPSGQQTTGSGLTTPPMVSTDATGSFYLIGTDLYDAELRWLRRLGPASPPSAYTALAPDGADGYVASFVTCASGNPPPCGAGDVRPGYYHRFDRATGELRETVRTPEWMPRLVPLPDGRRMIAIGTTTVALFDLTEAGARQAGTTATTGAVRASRAPSLSALPGATTADRAWTPRFHWAAPR